MDKETPQHRLNCTSRTHSVILPGAQGGDATLCQFCTMGMRHAREKRENEGLKGKEGELAKHQSFFEYCLKKSIRMKKCTTMGQ